ncbi:DUF1848 domain-containing protein [Spirochaeta isovalerica]|uniref:DUF1848 domain-containing protein n=1 Tax=Spirochaeta isovalerica TaxID=150 RepID=A0A841RB91_9SPIO|nr:DUF1848 domain-containing protein [Spirochaeta isovalerica]MBB6479682.1 hypothetical protein [Spirochaeta isovalerica]
MIISASRRTDIPSFYGRWFLNRLKAGEVFVRNPVNRKQVSVIPLSKDNVDCIVFWTKDPGPFLPFLDELDSYGIPYYFSITITPYGPDIETRLRSPESVIESVKSLSRRIGSKRIIWRYDPVIFFKDMDVKSHLKAFAVMAEQLEGITDKCVFSFLSEYGKISEFVKKRGAGNGRREERRSLVGAMAEIAFQANMKLASCALSEDFRESGVGHNRCIDPDLIGEVCGYPIFSRPDKSQREACGCAESRDIGSYNTCLHGCLYCYANREESSIRRKSALYNPDSPMLCDSLAGDENLTPCRNCESLRKEIIPGFSFDF